MESLFLAYKGKDTSPLYTAYFDGTAWHGDTRISDQPGGINPESDYNPGIATLNNRTYLIYKGHNTTDLYTCYFDGEKWNGDVRISDQNGGISPKSDFSPNLTAYKGLLYTVYKGRGTTDLYASWFDGTTWYGDKRIGDLPGGINPKTNESPAMVVFNNTLYLVYKGQNTSDLYVSWFDGTTWSGDKRIGDLIGGINPQSTASPGAAVFNNKLYLVYVGREDSTDLYVSWFDGTTWSGDQKISDQPGGIRPKSNYAPTVDIYGTNMYVLYRGQGVTRTLWVSWFDGATWHGDQKISDRGGGINPESDYPPGLAITASVPLNKATWMHDVSNATLLSNINIPGTHDSAAINTSTHTPYACHNASITKQLEYGIRLLDVRIQITQSGNAFTFNTCHGNTGSSTGVNVYQSLPSLLDECKSFLTNNASEVAIVSLKIDDWSNTTSRDAALEALATLLASYPTVSQSTLPTLGSVRGKIFLYNRINDNLALGCPISWPDNTNGSNANASSKRSYQVYVQDRYKDLPTIGANAEKLKLAVASYGQKASTPVVWSFASATWYGVFGVYIQGALLNYFGATPAASRLSNFGWTLLDYAFNTYNTDKYGALDIVTIIIASNFGYAGYDQAFKVVDDGHDDL